MTIRLQRQIQTGHHLERQEEALFQDFTLPFPAYIAGHSALGAAAADAQIIVAHRGASAYAPEHTIEAYRLGGEGSGGRALRGGNLIISCRVRTRVTTRCIRPWPISRSYRQTIHLQELARATMIGCASRHI